MKAKRPLYGLVIGIPEQRKIIDKHCFGTCGKIILGAIDGGAGVGELAVCRTPKKDCPQLDREMDEPIGDVNGEPVFVRKLKP